MNVAIANALPVFANVLVFRDCDWMRSAQEILDALETKSVKRDAIAKALKISQPNATRLFKPDPRSNKRRDLTYDEGLALIAEFGLAGDGDNATEPAYLNEELLMPIVQEIVARSRTDRSASAARPLASALARYLQQLVGRPAIHTNLDALEAVAQSVVPPPPGAKPQA